MAIEYSMALAGFLAGTNESIAIVLSGAGVSTASGIPDYRDHNGDWKHAQAHPVSGLYVKDVAISEDVTGRGVMSGGSASPGLARTPPTTRWLAWRRRARSTP